MAEKNLIGELDMYREAGIKPNFSDIAKRYGKDRHTVAAYWRAEGGRPRDGRADRAGSFDAHIEEVAAKAQLPGVTKKGIHEWLLHRYPGENLAGYNAFTQFMRKNGIAVGASVGPEPHPRFETPPGLQLQFDWKESVRMANRDGELFEFNVFAATLGHSRRHIFIRSGTRTTDDLVRCMYATIARLGGVPREWVTDNMSALVTVKGGRRLKVQRAYEFAKAAGFELKLCRPRSPQTKGKVESSNRFLSRLAAYQGDFDGWDDIDEIIARIEDASNSEPNETTGLPPSAPSRRRWATWCAWPGCRPRCWSARTASPCRCPGAASAGPPASSACPAARWTATSAASWWRRTWRAGRPTTRRTTPRPWPGSAGSATPPATSRRPPPPTSGCSTR